MKIKLSSLRHMIREELLGRSPARFAPTDDDNQVPGHLPNELPKSAALEDDPMSDADLDEHMHRVYRSFFLQENPCGAGVVSPVGAKGFYTDFDMTKDHMGTDNPQSFWYKSPGREPGTNGDPFRPEDSYAYLGFHVPTSDEDNDTMSPPAAAGENDTASRDVEPDEALNAGDDTGKVLGIGADEEEGVEVQA